MSVVWHENGRVPPLHDDELRQAALAMLRARRAMRGTLPAALIHDVALEMVLTIYLARGSDVPVDQLVSESTIPSGSARRWVAALAGEDMISVVDDAASLTPFGSARMAAMLTSVVQSQREMLGWQRH